MQLTDAFCYVLLTISVTATCIQAERRLELQERKFDKRLSRRDATLLIDSTPSERIFHKPKVIYRRLSQQRYTPPRPKYGPPRPKYGPPKSSRKPSKNYRGKVSHKYRPPSYKKRSPKPRYRPQHSSKKPTYGAPHKISKKPQSFHKTEPMGFGEPPSSHDNDHRSPKPDYDDFKPTGFEEFQKPAFTDFQKPVPDSPKHSHNHFYKPDLNDFHKPASDFREPGFSQFQNPSFNDFQIHSFDGFPKQNYEEYPPSRGYGEPPVDSYGAPVKSNLRDLTYAAAHEYPESTSHFDQDAFSYQSWKSNKGDQNFDNIYAFSKKQPTVFGPDDVFVTRTPNEANEELDLNSYSDIYSHRQKENKHKKKQNQSIKMLHKWKGNHKVKAVVDDEIVVGGQYAEPPARYVAKFQPSAQMYTDDDDFSPPGSLSDPELVASATNSPYVNYKNSNMAFSPQNLNDAFSIVDK